MSEIQLDNPKVLKNFILQQAKEGKGSFAFKEKVLVFINEQGLETIIPEEIAGEIAAKQKIVKKVEAPKVEEAPEEATPEEPVETPVEPPKRRGRPPRQQ